MDIKKELSFLRAVLANLNINNSIIDPSSQLGGKEGDILKILFGAEGEKLRFLDFFPEIAERTVYSVTDAMQSRYMFLRLPDSADVFLAGPYLKNELTREHIFELSERMSLPPRLTGEISYFYSSLPVIKDENMVFALINTFAQTLWGEKYETLDMSRSNKPSFNISENEIFAGRDIEIMEQRYSYEDEIMRAISQGNSHKAEMMILGFSDLAFDERTPDKLRNMKNYCIIMNTLFRKAAQKGGVHPLHLDKLSSSLAREIEGIQTLSKVRAFMPTILKSYCSLVQNQAMGNFSDIVKKTILKIESDVSRELSLKKLAEEASVNPAYLSQVFKKETGKTLTQYINSARMRLAKELLSESSLQVQTIAQHCGIFDLHYFCRIFKRETGKTPKQYREESLKGRVY